jgi:hypothetical protein
MTETPIAVSYRTVAGPLLLIFSSGAGLKFGAWASGLSSAGYDTAFGFGFIVGLLIYALVTRGVRNMSNVEGSEQFRICALTLIASFLVAGVFKYI